MNLHASPRLIAAAALMVMVAACMGPGPIATSSSSAANAPNACTGLPTSIDRSVATFRGENAYAYMVGLVCKGPQTDPQPNARVPGTENQTLGAAYLAAALRATGLQVSFQNFTGSQYEAIVQKKNTDGSYRYADAHYYYDPANGYCHNSDLVRMRGLPFTNIEARAGTPGGDVFLLLAHWDSKRHATQDPDPNRRSEPVLGANDGAAGVGILLELARTLQGRTGGMDVRLLLDDGEDGFEDCHPLAGTVMYADALASSVPPPRVRGILLLDMVGDPDSRFYKGCGQDQALMDRVWANAKSLDVRQFDDSQSCGGIVDDHKPFEANGLKAVDVIASPFPSYWHTTDDTPRHISADLLGAIGRVLTLTLDQSAASPAPIPW